MIMSFDVVITSRALANITNISMYISEYNSDIAELFVDSLMDKLNTELSTFPYMYREYFEWIRFIPFKWYVVFYRVVDDKKIIQVLSIVHWATDMNSIRF